MNADKGLNIIGAIVTVALVTTIVARPNSVAVVRAMWDGFNESLSRALGKGVSFGQG